MIDLFYRHSQTRCEGGGQFHLFQPVGEIHISDGILRRVIVRVLLAFVALDLQNGWNSLRTEGDFIPSAAAKDETWRKINLVVRNGLAHHLG